MTSQAMWMVRAGEGGLAIEAFRAESVVAIGWVDLGDLSALKTRADFARAAAQAYPGHKAGQQASMAGQTYRFVREIAVGDQVVSYDRSERVYLVGEVTGGYQRQPQKLTDYPNMRPVRWLGSVARDALSVAARNSLGAISTLFLIPPPVAREVRGVLDAARAGTRAPQPEPAPALADEADDLYKDVQARGFEFIKDRIHALDWDAMQELVAGLGLQDAHLAQRLGPRQGHRGVARRPGL